MTSHQSPQLITKTDRQFRFSSSENQNVRDLKAPENHTSTGFVWKNHFIWNLNILQQQTFRNKALKKLQRTLHDLDAQNLFSTFSTASLKTKGLIFALVHLPTNRLYVTATLKSVDRAVKQHWYSAHVRSSRFHKLLTKSKLRDYFFWPLETINSFTSETKARKSFWIKTLLAKYSGRKINDCPQTASFDKGKESLEPKECPPSPVARKRETSSLRSISPCRPQLKVWKAKELQNPSVLMSSKCAVRPDKPSVIKYHWHNLNNQNYRPTRDKKFKPRDESNYPHPDCLKDDYEGYLAWVAHVSGIDSIEEYKAWYTSIHEFYRYAGFYPPIPDASDFEIYPPLPILDYPHPDIVFQTMDKYGNDTDENGKFIGWTKKDDEIDTIFRSFCAHVMLSSPGESNEDEFYVKWYETIRPLPLTIQDFIEWYGFEPSVSPPLITTSRPHCLELPTESCTSSNNVLFETNNPASIQSADNQTLDNALTETSCDKITNLNSAIPDSTTPCVKKERRYNLRSYKNEC